jgi:hypothetical protein
MTTGSQLLPEMPDAVRDDWHSAGRLTNHTIHTAPDKTEEGSPLIFLALETDRFPFAEHGYHGIVATREELVEMARTVLACLE